MSGWIVRENPARVAEEVGRVPVDDARAVDAAVRAVEAAQPGWAARPVAERAAVLAAVADALDAACPAGLLARETGKPLADCRGEIRFSAAYLRWAAEHAPAAFADRETDDAAGRLLLRRRPYGVVAAVTPWNAPVILTVLKVGAALAAGDTVVVKPSPLAPLTVRAVLALFPEALARVVQGGAETGRALVGHPRVHRVAFTGGAAAARDIGATAARALTPVVTELGGNDAAVFLDDADLSDPAMDRLVMASFATAGQVCVAAKRLYVPRAMLGDFREAYLAAARRTLVLGDPLEAGTTVGPVVSADAAARVRALVDDAAARGADVTELGAVRAAMDAGYFVRPTLLTGLDDDAPVVAGEQFGPTVPLLVYDSEAEALARANAGDLGLGASVWSADEERAFAFARRFEAGFAFVNTHNRTGLALRAPFGGVKRSGHGREYGVEGLREYVQTCAVHAPAAFRPGGAGMPAGGYPS
ncbi:aldehyde dehydrogenase family protein [Actinomadura namibiensis]|uniref:Acyl-CoA reductase-like NAD-dependent aldehyde dehydrogenase n=1 Tax=Actinomadura namibiensis TaxID=182080 RepID=A0A7W3LZ34_ACTNM|nr:aldehyde dehydrogenase family protein [Actinomadura namibiensis]MBA8956858.1 acyl-CoA reductase-like NAD-dependent aldehyde dehydrogenase [Actinomadura namibiensis]